MNDESENKAYVKVANEWKEVGRAENVLLKTPTMASMETVHDAFYKFAQKTQTLFIPLTRAGFYLFLSFNKPSRRGRKFMAWHPGKRRRK